MTVSSHIPKTGRTRWILVIAGLVLIVGGVAGAVVSALQARYSNGPLDIRGALDAENGILTPQDFAATSVWIAVAAIGIVVLIVGIVRHALRARS
jgi:uncharacterized membrane protein HdeD (DUF308 family)